MYNSVQRILMTAALMIAAEGLDWVLQKRSTVKELVTSFPPLFQGSSRFNYRGRNRGLPYQIGTVVLGYRILHTVRNRIKIRKPATPLPHTVL